MKTLVRLAKEEDMAFVVHSWRSSFDGAPAVRGADKDHYFKEMSRVIGRLCGPDFGAAEVRVVCDVEDPDTLLSFVAFKGRELHYAYTRRDFRNAGLMRQALEGVHLDAYTFYTPRWHPPPTWKFTPRFSV